MNDKPVLVVEGISDVNRLTNIIDADFVICNGSAISQETIDYIKELTKVRTVIVFTDPDYPGIQIRNKIQEQVPQVFHAYVDRRKASNGKKLGIAECDEDEIKKAIKNYISYNNNFNQSLTMKDMVELRLTGDMCAKKNREKVSNYFHTGFSNAKTLLKHLNMLGITKEEIEGVLNGCK